ncbi:MAG: Uncharacterized protein XD72_1161 [Methanothrix harundinacea]|uniref:S-layer family duplication domain-containing protein n=1 Tax=Methanothrix harundinacea TaxID=301375 RepID=A0A101FTW8_9EURY|nr:MAG: Uncharacterized protein XD72_1161 [Methanothrix harundinacea]
MSRIAYLLASVLLVMQTAGGVEVFMSTRDSLTFADNLTLVVMDVEPWAGAGEGVVWLELRDGRGHLKSSVLRAGESFVYEERGEGLNLTIARIYAGGEKDLVDLELVSGEVVRGPVQRPPNGTDGNRDRDGPTGDSSFLNWGLAAVLALILVAWVYFGARQKGRRR